MLLKSTPNRVVTIRMRHFGKIRNVPLFKFDEKGEYNYPQDKWDKLSNTDQNKLYRHFGVKEEAKEIKEKHCKKCDFTCDNQGELLAHYREKHPKE